ncbi:MAG TPA: response regulator transcription factor [Actinophytocola sp.]|uniref:response regulator transcription factor n=1 Tax=Actinophytocola sp. TaxID=1872138 RepID=UPI002DBDE353|nr:response regulator transcription factor [Actinophytocola sp.]HEU5475064.1 response regulator transcription factor [Actinophytocola sp.]
MRVLLVEDDENFAASVSKALARFGHQPTHVARGGDAVSRHHGADLVLLDLLLPDCHGLDVLRELRRVTSVPIVVLTAIGDERTVVRALHVGADDYLVKPFGEAVLFARIDAVARRSRIRLEPPPRVVTALDVEIDLAAHRVLVAGTEIALTGIEFNVLAALAERRGTAVSRQQLMDEVWGDASATRAHALSVHLTGLRRKLNRPGLIVTLHGFGYRLEG